MIPKVLWYDKGETGTKNIPHELPDDAEIRFTINGEGVHVRLVNNHIEIQCWNPRDVISVIPQQSFEIKITTTR